MIDKILLGMGILLVIAFIVLFFKIKNMGRQLTDDSSIIITFNTTEHEEVDKIMNFILEKNLYVVGMGIRFSKTKSTGYLDIVDGATMSVYKWLKRKIPNDKILNIEVKKTDKITFINKDNLYEIKHIKTIKNKFKEEVKYV